jgi:hypothetical protein
MMIPFLTAHLWHVDGADDPARIGVRFTWVTRIVGNPVKCNE